MSDRKYRQRGYMDEERPKAEARPKQEPVPREMRAPNLPGFRKVVRCARCGNPVTAAVTDESRCSRCGSDLHSCSQCTAFDPGSRFECMQSVPARVLPKDTRNRCALFDSRTTVERETGSTAPSSARTAFDDLFK
jgi:hypothetical protein